LKRTHTRYSHTMNDAVHTETFGRTETHQCYSATKFSIELLHYISQQEGNIAGFEVIKQLITLPVKYCAAKTSITAFSRQCWQMTKWDNPHSQY